MDTYQAPAPDEKINVELKGMPLKLWWKVMEVSQKKRIPPAYFVFKTLAEAVDYDQENESYDLLLREIQQNLGEAALLEK